MAAKTNGRFPGSTGRWLAAALSLLLSLTACESFAGGAAAAAPESRLALENDHFALYTDNLTNAQLQLVMTALDKNYARIVEDLGAADPGKVKITIWSDPTKFRRMMRLDLGRVYAGATGYIAGSDEAELLFDAQISKNAVRDFARIVMLKVNPSIGNNPYWLWEAVSLYEAGMFTHPAILKYLQEGHYPTLAELDSRPANGPQIRDLGYVLGQFIVTRWGKPKLVELVRSNGDIPKTFGLPVADFEKQWDAWIDRTYLHIRLNQPDDRILARGPDAHGPVPAGPSGREA
jgi:hypothetical protein